MNEILLNVDKIIALAVAFLFVMVFSLIINRKKKESWNRFKSI